MSAAKKKKKKKTGTKPRSRRSAAKKPSRWRRFFGALWRFGRWPLLFGVAGLVFYLSLLDRRITGEFEGRRWDVPARVFAQPLELYAGRTLTAVTLADHLRSLGYRAARDVTQPGQFRVAGNTVTFISRPFAFWDSVQPAQHAVAKFAGDAVSSLVDADAAELPLMRLDPVMIGSIVPGTHEDRIVLPPQAVPQRLRDVLVAVEDRRFYQHHGVNFAAIARAALVNLRAGRIRQGGSTLTQQLVKNYFLTNRQTYTRKFNEVLMAMLLEARYDKRDLINGYINEVFLGQDGARAVHGFALGSQFYFGVPLAELNNAQIALLVGIIRGPSYYDPRRHPERALERRDRILRSLGERGVLTGEEVSAATASALSVVEQPGRVSGTSPAFMDAVRTQLRRDYAAEDLNSAGLRIFTTLDPFVQAQAEQICANELAHVERDTGSEVGSLEVAAVISDPQSGELLAAVGIDKVGEAAIVGA